MCVAACTLQECVCFSVKLGPRPGPGGVTVTFWDALAQVPRGAGSLAPRPPTPGRSLAVGAMTSWGSQTETPAPGEREVLSVTPGFVTSSPTHLAAGASWPLQPGAECQPLPPPPPPWCPQSLW